MGVDLCTYRRKIGGFNGGRSSVSECIPTDSTPTPHTDCMSGISSVPKPTPHTDCMSGVISVGALWFIAVLLLMSGIEPNPGPPVSHYMNDPLFKNWVRAAYAFKYLKSGLVAFVSNEICQRHNDLKQRVTQQNSNVQPCSVCTSNNLLPDHGSHGCNRKPRRDCFCRQVAHTRRPCPNNFCGQFYHHVVEDHVEKSPLLSAGRYITKLKWYNDVVTYAKCYLGSPSSAISLTELDSTGFLSIVINNCHIHTSIDDIQAFKQCRKDRNTVFHSGNFKLTDSELDGFIDNMILVLEDRKCLINDQRSQHAVISLKQLKVDAIHISDADIVDIIKDATRAITELGEDVQQDIDRTRQEILSEHEDIIREINKRKADVIQEMEEHKAAAVNDIKRLKPDTNNELTKQKMRTDLVQIYKHHCRTIPVSPLFDNKDEDLLKIYKNPTMISEEQAKNCKQISGYKSVFYKEDVAMKQVYVTGDAGVGKTSFCTRMCLLWSMAKSGYKFEKEDDKELQEDLEFMAKFDFVFYINLRDTSHTHVINMIVEQMFYNCKEKYESVIESILRDEPCLIILDALDEWDPTTTARKPYKVPERIYSEQCFCLTTCRPYRIEKVRLSHKKDVDHLIKITGLHGDSSQSYIEHVISYMNDEHSGSRSAGDFTDEVEECGLTEQLCIPIFISHLVMLWFEQKLTGMPRGLIYANILEMLFKRAEKKNITCPSSPPSTWKLPDSLSGMEYLNKHVCLLYNVCHLSFRALFKQDHTVSSSLVFNRRQLQALPYNFTTEETDFLCKIGLLSQNEVLCCSSEEKLKISFIHKSYMEFLAAIFITSFDQSDSFTGISKTWDSLDDVLEFENLFILLAGFSYDRVKPLFEIIHLYIANDLTSCRNNAIFHDYDFSYLDKIKSLQTVVNKCYQEVSACGCSNSSIVLKLEHFVFDNIDDNAGSDTCSGNSKSKTSVPSHGQSLKQLLKSNSQCVKSLYSVSGRYSVEFSQIKQLQCLRVGKILPADYAQFTQLVSDNKLTLETLCIKGDSATRPLIHGLPVRSYRRLIFLPSAIRRQHNRSIQHLTALSLSNVKLRHSDFLNLVQFLSNAVRFEDIELQSVLCDTHQHGDGCDLSLNLQNHTKLNTLHLSGVDVSCHLVNTSCLKKIVLGSFSERIASCYSDFVNCIKYSELECLQIYSKNMLDDHTIETCLSTIRTLSSITSVTLSDMNIPDNGLLELHPDVTYIEHILLFDITMSCQCFKRFVECIVYLNALEYVQLQNCKISSLDREFDGEMSEKYSLDYMFDYLSNQQTVKVFDKDYENSVLAFDTSNYQ